MSTVPKSRISRSKRGMRRSHQRVRFYSAGRCPNCQAVTRPHRICRSCGWYKNRQVIQAPVQET